MEIYSIADARSQLPKIIHNVEAGEITQLTRRDKPVAVLLSITEYDSLINNSKGNLFHAFKAYRALIKETDDQSLENDLTDSEIDSWRDRDPGRGLSWE